MMMMMFGRAELEGDSISFSETDREKKKKKTGRWEEGWFHGICGEGKGMKMKSLD